MTIPLSRGLYQMRGLLAQFVVRSALIVVPLGMVILLCVFMFSFRAKGKTEVIGSSELSAQAATLSPEQRENIAHAQENNPQAAFEQLRITHARVNVPQ